MGVYLNKVGIKNKGRKYDNFIGQVVHIFAFAELRKIVHRVHRNDRKLPKQLVKFFVYIFSHL